MLRQPLRGAAVGNMRACAPISSCVFRLALAASSRPGKAMLYSGNPGIQVLRFDSLRA